MARLEALWPDNSVTTAESYAELEAAIRAEQYTPFKTRREFRRAMRHRAHVWSGAPLKPVARQTSRQFIESLVDAGLFSLFTNAPTEPKE